MIPRCFKGETVVVIASGPSLTQEDVDFCKGKARVAVVNDNYKLAPWADLLYAADTNWWDHHNGVPQFAGQKWTQCQPSAEKYGLNWVMGYWNHGPSLDRNHIHYGMNSGFQCVNLVFLMGARRVILLGFDMQMTGGKRHWFGNHPGVLDQNSRYEKWVRYMDNAALKYRKAGCEILNASRETALKEYRRVNLADCFEFDPKRPDLYATGFF